MDNNFSHYWGIKIMKSIYKKLKLASLSVVLLTLVGCSTDGIVTSLRENDTRSASQYTGDKNLRAIYSRGFIYVISDYPLQNVKISLNKKDVTKGTTKRWNSNLPAYVSNAVSLKISDLVDVTAVINGSQHELQLTLMNTQPFTWRYDAKVGQPSASDIEEPEADTTPIEKPTFPQIANNQISASEFLNSFNAYRARHGLPAARLSQRLTDDAAINNQRQRYRGLGHFYGHDKWAQCSLQMSSSNIESAINEWHNSYGHRVLMQRSVYNCIGIHKSGKYWTLNLTTSRNCPQ